jgi:hypothetical protein
MTSCPDSAFWLHYYVHRVRIAAEDTTVTDRELRQWLIEVIEDLADFAQTQYPVTTSVQTDAERLAAAQHAFIFHDGPDPDASDLSSGR